MLPLSPFSICNGPQHPLYSAYELDSPLEQPVSRSSLVFPLVLNPQLHTPCISSPNHMKHQPSAHKLKQIRFNSPQSAAELIINALPLRGQSLYKSRLVTELQTSQHTAVISSTASSTKFNWQYLKKFTLPTAGP